MKWAIALPCIFLAVVNQVLANTDATGSVSDGVCETLKEWELNNDNPLKSEEDFKALAQKGGRVSRLLGNSQHPGLRGCLFDPAVARFAPAQDLVQRSTVGKSHRCLQIREMSDGNHWWAQVFPVCAGMYADGMPGEIAVVPHEEICHADAKGLLGDYLSASFQVRDRVLRDAFRGATMGITFPDASDTRQRIQQRIQRIRAEYESRRAYVFHNGDGEAFAVGTGIVDTNGRERYYRTKYRKMTIGAVDYTVAYNAKTHRREKPMPFTDGVHFAPDITVCYDKADGNRLHPAIKYMEFILKLDQRGIAELSFDFQEDSGPEARPGNFENRPPFDG